ncbi:MAG: PqqD family protein [Candidatus Scalinduaceae bacterium]
MKTDKSRRIDRNEEKNPKGESTIDITNVLPCRVNGIKEYNLSDETVLYFMENETVHSLNCSAKAIWEICDGSLNIVEISQILGKRFGCSGTELLPDVKTAVTKLQKLSLLELKNAPRKKSI